MELIYKQSKRESHPLTACMVDAGERVSQDIEFRDENQLRTFWCGWYYGSGKAIPLNIVMNEVTEEEYPR